MGDKTDATWHPGSGPVTDHTDLIKSARRDISYADRCNAIGVMPAVHQIHRRLRQVTDALADSVPREQYDTVRTAQEVDSEEARTFERERDEARAERDALAAQRSQMRALVIDALANADDTHMGWDAEMSATALLDILDTAPPVSLAQHDAEVKAQSLNEAADVISPNDSMNAWAKRWLTSRAAAIRAEANG